MADADLELVTHKPSAWALAGLPLYVLGAMMLGMPWMSTPHNNGEVALIGIVMVMGVMILIGAVFALAAYEGVVIRSGTRTIETWWRIFGFTRRRSGAVSDDYAVVCTAQRARAANKYNYVVSIVGPAGGKPLDQVSDVAKARELAREIADRLKLPVRDETPA